MNDPHRLAGADAKLNWADAELHALDRAIKAWDGSYTTSSDFYAEASVVAMRIHMPPPPTEWGVRIGNMVHCYRSALDYLVSDLAVLNDNTPVEGPGGNQFPILTDPPTTRKGKPVTFAAKTTTGWLAGLDPAHVAMIERLQPYRPENQFKNNRNPLAKLASLSNTDKHRVLRPFGIEIQPDQQVAYKLMMQRDIEEVADGGVILRNRVGEGSVVAWAVIVPGGPDPQMYFDGLLPLRVVSDTGVPALDDMYVMGRAIRDVIDWFRPLFYGCEPGEQPGPRHP